MQSSSLPKYSAGLRLWHWLDALVVTALLITYFLRQTLLSGRANATLFTAKLAEHQITVTPDQARELNGLLVDHLWTWHIYLGYALTALLLLRLVLLFADDANAFGKAWTSVKALRAGWDFRTLHTSGVKVLYALFYLLQIVMVATGLSMVFSGELGLSDAVGNAVGEVHETVMWFFLVFVIAHIGGVFFAEHTTDPGIVSDMINGGQRP